MNGTSNGRPGISGRTLLELLIGGLAAVFFGKALFPSPKKVFVSYDHDEEARYRDLLRAWDKNPRFNFNFDLRSPTDAIKSDDEGVVKRALTPKIKQADYLLVLVGSKTATSKWIRWEIERATDPDINLKVAAIKLGRNCPLPSSLNWMKPGCKTGFSVENVTSALQQAVRRHLD